MKMSSMGEKIVLSAVPTIVAELGRGVRDWFKWKREQHRREKEQMKDFIEQQEKEAKEKAEVKETETDIKEEDV